MYVVSKEVLYCSLMLNVEGHIETCRLNLNNTYMKYVML